MPYTRCNPEYPSWRPKKSYSPPKINCDETLAKSEYVFKLYLLAISLRTANPYVLLKPYIPTHLN